MNYPICPPPAPNPPGQHKTPWGWPSPVAKVRSQRSRGGQVQSQKSGAKELTDRSGAGFSHLAFPEHGVYPQHGSKTIGKMTVNHETLGLCSDKPPCIPKWFCPEHWWFYMLLHGFTPYIHHFDEDNFDTPLDAMRTGVRISGQTQIGSNRSYMPGSSFNIRVTTTSTFHEWLSENMPLMDLSTFGACTMLQSL